IGKEGYEINAGAAIVSGDLVFQGEDTGVDIEIRSGGPAIGFQQVTAQMYSDTDITMGYVSTDEAITNAAELPTIAVVAPLEINPQIIMWDPETYPEVQSIADLKDVEGGPAIIRYFGTATYMPDLVGRGVVVEEQLDGSYDGSPAVFVAEGGAIAQQGFASAEPYIYENEVDEWGKPVAFELIHDVGLQAYAASMALRPETFDELSASGCLAALVPMMQQAQIDFIEDPSNTIPLILELVEAYDNGWQYSQGVAEFSVDTQLELGLVGNGPDDILGNFDLDRAQGVIDTLNEIADEVGFDIPADLAPEAFLTNEFIDESIGLG
ncbi:MAG: ABC transporter substrate-binding protein, partial [Actinomycetota bacterium]